MELRRTTTLRGRGIQTTGIRVPAVVPGDCCEKVDQLFADLCGPRPVTCTKAIAAADVHVNQKRLAGGEVEPGNEATLGILGTSVWSLLTSRGNARTFRQSVENSAQGVHLRLGERNGCSQPVP